MSYRSFVSTTKPGTTVEGELPDDVSAPTEPVQAAAVAQRILSNLSLEVTNAESAVGAARARGVDTRAMDVTARWVRGSVENLDNFLRTTPAVRALNELRTRAEQIAETASALKALAERSGR